MENISKIQNQRLLNKIKSETDKLLHDTIEGKFNTKPNRDLVVKKLTEYYKQYIPDFGPNDIKVECADNMTMTVTFSDRVVNSVNSLLK